MIAFLWILGIYYVTSYALVIFMLANPMRIAYQKEGIKPNWWMHLRLVLIPFLGSILSLLIMLNDFVTHLNNEAARNAERRDNMR